MSRHGFTLLELLTVIIIAGILAGLGTAGFVEWRKKYDIDNQMRQTQADLMSVRVMSMTRRASHFVSLGSTQMRVYRDANSNGTLETGSDTVMCLWDRKSGEGADSACSGSQSVSSRTMSRVLTWSGDSTITFDSRGLAGADNTICIDYTQVSRVSALYDCINVTQTRIGIGKMADQGGACASANCRTKQ